MVLNDPVTSLDSCCCRSTPVKASTVKQWQYLFKKRETVDIFKLISVQQRTQHPRSICCVKLLFLLGNYKLWAQIDAGETTETSWTQSSPLALALIDCYRTSHNQFCWLFSDCDVRIKTTLTLRRWQREREAARSTSCALYVLRYTTNTTTQHTPRGIDQCVCLCWRHIKCVLSLPLCWASLCWRASECRSVPLSKHKQKNI